MTINTAFLAISLIALFAWPLYAAVNRQEPDPSPDSSGQIDTISDNDIEPVDVSREQTPEQSSELSPELSPELSSEQSPQSDNLRARDIGDAFKNFQPSEEISADNAVTFPVDI